MSKAYKIEKGGMHDRFQNSRAKIQMIAGGFGNGKTTAGTVKALKIARMYPGSNGLVARSTYPKLSNTIRKEFRAWAPKSWVVRDVDSKVNVMELDNGSIINFSHVQQTGKAQEQSTSNLLSATYDWILIDQVEDPEITHKDFLDLLGRLRGQTTYQGNEDNWPSSGPRMMILLCNPTRNWVYRELVKPLKDYEKGIPNDKLIVDDDGKPLMELFEGSTYENASNLPDDFIKTQEAAYKGQMRSRFLLGEWGAYEGLVYPDYDPTVHLLNHDDVVSYYWELLDRGAVVEPIEAYDHGIAVPACYLFGFPDDAGNVFVMDGFYEKEQSISVSSKRMKKIRDEYGWSEDPRRNTVGDPNSLRPFGDPSIFKRSSGNSATVGTSTSGLFKESGIQMQKGNNDIINGIAKVQSYLFNDPLHRHPIYEGVDQAPRIFFSKKLEFMDSEFTDYYWKKDTSGEYEDVPNGKNDHAMDALKYFLTKRPRVVTFTLSREKWQLPSHYRHWREAQDTVKQDPRKHRYAGH